jgi:hypothetical protein
VRGGMEEVGVKVEHRKGEDGVLKRELDNVGN